MKNAKFCLITSIILIITACSDGLKKVETFFSNKQLHTLHYEDEQGRLQGESITYRSDGSIESKVNWKNGKKNGTSTYYDSDGKKTSYVTYKENVLDGKTCEYYPDGRIKNEGVFKNGEQWSITSYLADGQVEQRSSLFKSSSGSLIDKQLFYNESQLFLEAWQDLSDSTYVYKYHFENGLVDEFRAIDYKRNNDHIKILFEGPKDNLTKITVIELEDYKLNDKNRLSPTKTVTEEGESFVLKEFDANGMLVNKQKLLGKRRDFRPNDVIELKNENVPTVLLIRFLTKRKEVPSYTYESVVFIPKK